MLTFELNPHVAEAGFTQSEMTLLDTCGKKWYWRYARLLTLRGSFSWATVIGSAVHTTLERMYETCGDTWETPPFLFPAGTILTPADEQKEQQWRYILDGMMTAYSQHHFSDFERWKITSLEETVEVEHWGFKFRGKIDMRYRDTDSALDWIIDHKTTFRLGPDITGMWNFKFQFMFYLWLCWKAGKPNLRGYQVNAIRKPELRLGKTETLAAFQERIRQDMVHEPQKYFYRAAIPMDVVALQRFEDEVLWPKVRRLQVLANVDSGSLAGMVAHNMNTDACYLYNKPCEFLKLCMEGEAEWLHEYDARPAKHEELEGEPAE